MTRGLPLLAIPLASVLSMTAAADFSSMPLRQRQGPAAGAKPFANLPAEETHVDVANVFNDPRMWGDRFRELTLGAVETGVAIADFDGDGQADIFAVSKNGPCALYRQVAPGRSGLVVPGDSRSAAVVPFRDGAIAVVVARSNGPLLVFAAEPQN